MPDSDPPQDGGGGPTSRRARAPWGEAGPCSAEHGRPGTRFARTRQLTSQAVIGGSPMHEKSLMTRVRTRFLRGGTVVLGAAAIGIGLAAPASAADWTGVAQCESSGNW